VQDLLFTSSVQHAAFLVLCELLFFLVCSKEVEIVLIISFAAGKGEVTEFFDLLPHLKLKFESHEFQTGGLENIAHIIVII